MDDLTWPLFVLVLGLVTARYARRHRLWTKWSVFRRRVSKVGAARQGLVRLEGRAAPVDGQFVRPPISEARCLFYDFVVDDNSDEAPRQVRREYRGVWFQLDDGTGTALVKFLDSGQSPAVPVEFDGPPFVSCAIPHDREVARGAELRATLERASVIRAGDDVPRHMAAREGCIMPGDLVSIVGLAGFELDPTMVAYRDPPLRYVITHAPGQLLAIAASRGAGRA
jgi:hypothetical protein